MESVLALLPQEREVVTEDGLSGVLSLKLDTVRIEVAGYGSSSKKVTATRTYPNLDGQDTSYIPKTVEDNGRTLTLQTIQWEAVGSEGNERYTATATYSGTAKSSYVSGYTVTADYVGTVSRISLDRVRYVAIFSGVSLNPVEPEPDHDTTPTDPNGQGAGVDNPSVGTPGTEAPDTTVPQHVENQQPTQGDGSQGGSVSFPWNTVYAALGVIAILGVGVVIALIIKRRSERYYDEEQEER